MMASGSRISKQDRMGYVISQLFMVRFSNGSQQNDRDTLLSTVLLSYKAKTYFSCLHGFFMVLHENHCLSPAFLSQYISVSNVKIHEG